VSPILVRPVREQFEHDRVIRVLQGRYRRKYEVAINPGAEQNAPVEVGSIAMYPDLVLFSQERGRKLQGTVEVETTESINTLEALAQWAQFSRLRAPFYLYVPPKSIDAVRRLCTEHQVIAAEIWTYHMAADQVRFTMVHRSNEAPVVEPARPALAKVEKKITRVEKPEKRIAAKAASAPKKPAGKPAKPSKPAKPVAAKKPAKKAPPKKAARSSKTAKAGKRR
jgi:hypothetical protein